jgi:hypothetical protein
MSTWATCPVAWTPASVRPAARTITGVRNTVDSASSMTPATVRWPACDAHPAKSVPS